MFAEFHVAAGVRTLDAEDGLGQRGLAGAGLADQPERLAVEQLEVDLDQRRHVVPALVEGLGDLLDGQHLAPMDGVLADDRGRLEDLAHPVAMMAARPAARRDLDDRRLGRPAQLGRDRTAVDEHAGRQVRADLRQVARDGREGALRLADAVARQRPEEAERVRVLRMLEDCLRVALLDDLAGVHDADPVTHRPDDAEVVRDQQDRSVRLGLETAHEVENARLDGRVQAGRRLVEDEELRVRCERDGDDDPLLHPAGQLVRVALRDPARIRDLDPLERCQGAGLRLRAALAEDGERLGDLRADLRRRVEGRARVLVDHRRVVDPELADLLVGHLGDVLAADEDPATGDDAVAGQVADRRVGRRRLAAAGFADQAV